MLKSRSGGERHRNTPAYWSGTQSSPKPNFGSLVCWKSEAKSPKRRRGIWQVSITMVCRFAPGPLRAAYEEVAARHPRAILIDGRLELTAVSPDGLLGDHVIQDTHHPTLLGSVALAGAVLRELERRGSSPTLSGPDFHWMRLLVPITLGWTTINGRRCVSGRACTLNAWRDTAMIRSSGWRSHASTQRPRRRIRHGEPIGELGLLGLPDDAIRHPIKRCGAWVK